MEKFEITREWFERRAGLEGDLEISAGRRLPPAYGNCVCTCHRGSGIIHFVACCHPPKLSQETTNAAE